MARIGVLGGLGPSATVDFMDCIVRATPAARDQEHLPVIVASLPHVYDRSLAILGRGEDPLPQLLQGIDVLNDVGVGVVAVPCNSAHHWYAQMAERSQAPVIHIAEACVAAVPAGAGRVAVFATQGALVSGFYQRALGERGIDWIVPDAAEQASIDRCIFEIKGGRMESGGAALTEALAGAKARGAAAVILGCTELPIASRHGDAQGLALIDSTAALANATVAYALARGWNRPPWVS